MALTPYPKTAVSEEQAIEQDSLAIKVGDVLEGQWRVERKVGEGGMGTVVLAHDLKLDRKVAIKLLARHLCGDAKAVARFEREARLTAMLEHPNIVSVYAVGRWANRPFMVMKYLSGLPLSARLKEGKPPFPMARVAELVDQLCAGLDFIHGRGLVHRDIKPSNIFIGPDGHATLLDFGILRDLKSDSVTTDGLLLGTVTHMAPEQLKRTNGVDYRADLYALGVVVFELLAGKDPFLGGTDVEVIQRKLSQAPPEPRDHRADVSPALNAVVRKALAHDPDERYQSARDFQRAFADAVNGVGPVEKIERRTAPLVLPPVESRSPSGPGRRKWVLLGLATGIVLAGALVAFAPWGSEPQTLPASPPVPAAPQAADAVPTPEPAAVSAPAPVEAPPPKAVAKPVARPKPRPKAAAKPVAPVPAVATSGTLRVVTLFEGKSTWALVSLNGDPRGGTPVSLEVPKGTHTVRIERPGFQSVERKVKVAGGETRTVQIELRP